MELICDYREKSVYNKLNKITSTNDKYKNNTFTLKDCLQSDICFLCLPTLYDESNQQYNKSSITETCEYLQAQNYSGIVVIKSTVEPKTTDELQFYAEVGSSMSDLEEWDVVNKPQHYHKNGMEVIDIIDSFTPVRHF